MNWPVEDIGRVRVNGFSILDDDFDLMACDLCRCVREEPGTDRIRESVATVLKFVAALWQGPTKLKPAQFSDSLRLD
jgi:hypothetical protein